MAMRIFDAQNQTLVSMDAQAYEQKRNRRLLHGLSSASATCLLANCAFISVTNIDRSVTHNDKFNSDSILQKMQF